MHSNSPIARRALVALAVIAVAAIPSGSSAQQSYNSIAEVRKAAIDAWNSQAPAVPYVRVGGIITAQPSGPDKISTSYFFMQDSGSAGTELPPGSGKRYSNGVKVFFGSNSGVLGSQLQRGDVVEVVGLAKVFNGGGSTLGMEVEIDASLSTGVFRGSVVERGMDNPPPPVQMKLTDLPFAGGVAGGENLVTRHRIMGAAWYPEPTADPASENHFVDNPYQGMLVRITGARKWGVYSFLNTSGIQQLGDFFLTDVASPDRILRVRAPTSTNLDPMAVSNGNTDGVTGMFETRQVLVGRKAYSIAQLVPRETADVQDTGQPASPCITSTQAFVDFGTADRTRLPGTTVLIRAWANATGQTITADLSAFGGSAAQALTPGAIADDPYVYSLVIPEAQPGGQYIVPIKMGDQQANVFVSVAQRVDSIMALNGLPDDMWVYVNTPRVVTSGALGYTGTPPAGFTGGFRYWLYVGDQDGVGGILGYGWPAGNQAEPASWIQYAIGEKVWVFGQLTTYFNKREVNFPGGTATYSIKTDEPITAPRPVNIRLDKLQPISRPNAEGVLVRVTGKVTSVETGARRIYLQDATGAKVTVKVLWRQANPPLAWYPAVGKTVTVTGLADGYQAADPESGLDTYTVDILPRNEADLVKVD